MKVVIGTILSATQAWEPGSKEHQALLRAATALTPIFGKAQADNMIPGGIAAMIQSGSKGPPTGAPPPGGMPPMKPPPPSVGPLGPESGEGAL